MNVKVFNLMSWVNEAKFIVCHESCKCKCILDGSACNMKQWWNNDICHCHCHCKELVDYSSCDEGFIWNRSTCNCECDKTGDVGGCLDYIEFKRV